MKNNPLVAILMALLFLSTAATFWRMAQFEHSFRKIQRYQLRRNEVTAVENVMNSLLLEAQEYENKTKSPDMARLLATLKTPANTAAPAKPAK
jgi:hypothetical protein